MAIIESLDGLVTSSAPNLYGGSVATTLPLYSGRRADYAAVYRSQHEVRSIVDFLARNLAQVPLHAYRKADNGRERISTGPLARTIAQPDPMTTGSQWMQALVKDLAIYDEAFRIKVAGPDGRVALIRVPVPLVEILGNSMLMPEGYRISGRDGAIEYTADEVIHFHGYNPLDLRRGLSPLESLRQLIAEQVAAAEHREGLWQRGARASLVIERPAGAPQWSDAARSRFRAEWEASYTGQEASGKTAVLEEGMTAKPLETFSPRDAQYLEVNQLAREIVATAYGVPLGLVGLGSANYSSLTQQHRQLYQDCLGPWLRDIEQTMTAQLLPEFGEGEDTYLEFQLAEKLRGSFEEQAAVLQASVGAPYMTRNEARARLNLPDIEGGDDIVTPLNVLVGGQASPQDSAPQPARIRSAPDAPQAPVLNAPGKAATTTPEEGTTPQGANVSAELVAAARARDEAADRINGKIREALIRQGRSVRSRAGAATKSAGQKADVAAVFDAARFNRELADDLRPEIRAAAIAAARTIGPWEPDNADNWIDAVADSAAEEMNAGVQERVAEALKADNALEALDELYETMTGNEAILAGLTLAAAASNFGRAESAQANQRRTKTWVTTSGNPRGSHAQLAGMTIGIGETFPNGGRWPGDPNLPADEKANCRCLIDFEQGI